MKKEENFSPNLYPMGFGSICSISGSTTGQNQSTTTHQLLVKNNQTAVKIELNSNSQHKPSSVKGLNSEDLVACSQSETDVLSEVSNLYVNGSQIAGNNVLPGPGSGALPSTNNFMSGPNSTIRTTVGHCLDYMQQNHIFVFSTQLANKGAQSVINGQFQTIIAYHCTQPATKSFLEDFFMKSPMNKLQRQNSMGLSICNISAPENITQASWQSPNPNTNTQSDNDLMSWKTKGSNVNNNSRNNLDASQGSSASHAALKLLEDVESMGGQLVNCGDDSNIILLQGVKVPDVNLTPQQRQHREEQLAKIKKITEFLFPENDNGLNNLHTNTKHTNDVDTLLYSKCNGKQNKSSSTGPQITSSSKNS